MTATRPRALSVAEMQAAVDALLRGDFAEPQAARFAARTEGNRLHRFATGTSVPA